MIGIVDYGLGNIAAFATIYRRLGIDASPVSTGRDLARAERLILPGVGAFDWAMHRLIASGLQDDLQKAVCDRRIPVLGVCVGMQMMTERSEEGVSAGLGWIPGEVRRLTPAIEADLPLPHMGWNDVHARADSPLFAGMEPRSRFYFLHSFVCVPRRDESITGVAEYGSAFACAFQCDNVYGVQFHPEKSHEAGVRLLSNFAGVS